MHFYVHDFKSLNKFIIPYVTYITVIHAIQKQQQTKLLEKKNEKLI